MLLYLKFNNYTIYNQEVVFSMMANMHYSRFPSNVASVDGVHALKTAVLPGPNNTGKTNFVRAIAMMRAIMPNQSPSIVPSIFSGSAVVEAGISFLDIRYDAGMTLSMKSMSVSVLWKSIGTSIRTSAHMFCFCGIFREKSSWPMMKTPYL